MSLMHNPLQPFLDRFGVVILDGAMATELEGRGADLNDPLWSAKVLIDSPSLIRQVHHDYFAAGADVAISASYQATFAGFAQRGLNHREAAEMMRLSVCLAQEAREQFWSDPTHRSGRLRPLVAASVGCYGAALHDGSEYRGDYGLTVEELMAFHRPRMEVLAHSGADLLACETVPCRAEGEALVRLLTEFPQTPAWLSFSCRDEEHVCHGERLADCVALAGACPQVVAVGLNCTPPQYVAGLLRSVAGTKGKPLLVYPNSGESWDARRRCWCPGSAAVDFEKDAPVWQRLGARLIGGCCRTTPAHIRQIARACRR
jgi:homocysteine S-methyltransferase